VEVIDAKLEQINVITGNKQIPIYSITSLSLVLEKLLGTVDGSRFPFFSGPHTPSKIKKIICSGECNLYTAEELEEKVRQRTANIAGLQEGQRQMMQEMAHGLQTPITILKGELIQLRQIASDGKKIKSIERSIDRVSKFIYDMLRLAKLESETKDAKKEIFDLSRLLNELIESYEIIANEKNIKIDHKIAKRINFFGNEKAIEEMITNLVSNSVEYIKEDGDKKISLNLRQNQDSIELIVADNGIGIDKQDISKLFQRFYRAGNKEPARHKGTGLGLAICKEIIQKHNGSIRVESEKNEGAKFIVTFPIPQKIK